MSLIYPIESPSVYPKHLSPDYRSTVKRSPSKPLIIVPQTLSELTGPVYGHDVVQEGDNDLTKQHKGEPLGERIIVHGHILDEDKGRCPTLWSRSGRPMPAADTSTISTSTRRRSTRISPAPAAP
jgi:hypothetical protein